MYNCDSGRNTAAKDSKFLLSFGFSARVCTIIILIQNCVNQS